MGPSLNYSSMLAAVDDLLYNSYASEVHIDFLMPNSIIISQEVSNSTTLAEIKADLWDKAREYPLFGTLHGMDSYHFACISSRAETVELLDETKCLPEVKPFMNFLKVIERKGNEAEKKLNHQIGELIGKSLKEFDALKNPEVNEFRWRMKFICDKIVSERSKLLWPERALYQYPCRLAPSPELPSYVQERLNSFAEGQLVIAVHFDTANSVTPTCRYTFKVKVDTKPSELLELALGKRSNNIDVDKPISGRESICEYVLKTFGKEEYLLEEVPLCQYISVREHICLEESPVQLLVVPCSSIRKDLNQRSLRNSFSDITLSKKKSINSMFSWNISESFRIYIGIITKLSVDMEDPQTEVMIEAGIYHGGTALCGTKSTKNVLVIEGNVSVEQTLTFDIEVLDIPRNAKLCFAIYEVGRISKAKSKANDIFKNPIAWVNTSVFDYRGQLKSGAMSFYAWGACEDRMGDFDFPNPLGTVVSNPDHDRAITFTVTFTKYQQSVAFYPCVEYIMCEGSDMFSNEDIPIPTQSIIDEIMQIADRDPTTDLHEQERKLLWTYRGFCKTYVPRILSKLLQCVDWNKHTEVAQMLVLLQDWSRLPPENALELLDYAYAESAVRKFAVDCLSELSDEDLLLYLMQVVQALKHENYLDCDLVEFLLHRALLNMRIGHYFFWYLRSEMHVPSVSIRFGLILEAYCRGAVGHMRLLERQLNALNKFKEMQDVVRQHRSVREKAIQALQEYINKDHMKACLSGFLSSLDPMYRISSIRIEKCKSMDSKMTPLWLEFANDDHHGQNVYILYKRGDDLRQDMLTLQMIRIMDKIWKENGYDLRMNPYGCLSTDNREGMIQIVVNAETIANIQRQKGLLAATCAFRKGSLLGYCVATYVLGIADRHSDNIMIMQSGQVFHIDFGHILGHFKEKFGIKRERQPFVLTHDFIYVITKGRHTRSDEYIQFKDYCEKAFLILRRYGSFIISLFALMISTGLPELQSEKDLDYLKETLRLQDTEKAALEHFRSKFDEALANAWKTSVSWAFHSMSKNNK